MSNELPTEILLALGINDPTVNQLQVIESILSKDLLKSNQFFNVFLSKNEQQCLFWSAHGKSYCQIARIMGLKPNTVKDYKKRILRKLNATTMTQAIFQSMRQGYFADN